MANKLSYIGVKGLIVRDDGSLLITQEPTWFDGGGKWELPGGKLAEGEENTPLRDILLREIKEELGAITVEVEKVVSVMRRPWNKPESLSDLVFLAVYICRYKDGDIVLSEENNAYAWVTVDTYGDYTYIDGYKEVLDEYFKV